jgi:hypothetical protein
MVSLEFILSGDFSRRALSLLCEHIHSRIRLHKLRDQSTQSGMEFRQVWSKEGLSPLRPWPEAKDAIANLENLLPQPHLSPINQEYQYPKNQRHRRLEWYSLLGGPSNLRQLAISLNHQTEYDYLYRSWSSIAHATNLNEFLTEMSPGQAGFVSIRFPGSFKDNAIYAITFLLRSTKLMIDHYRSGEDISRWYNTEVRPRFTALRDLPVLLDTQETF